MGYKLGYHILVLPNQVLLINSVLTNEVLLCIHTICLIMYAFLCASYGVCVCYPRMCLCVFLSNSASTYVRTSLHKFVQLQLHIRTYVCTYVCLKVCTHVCIGYFVLLTTHLRTYFTVNAVY